MSFGKEKGNVFVTNIINQPLENVFFVEISDVQPKYGSLQSLQDQSVKEVESRLSRDQLPVCVNATGTSAKRLALAENQCRLHHFEVAHGFLE
jgi:hypothetical protein